MMFGDAELLQDGSPGLPGQPLVPLLPGRQEQVVVSGLLDEPERYQLLGCQWRMEYIYVILVILIDYTRKKIISSVETVSVGSQAIPQCQCGQKQYYSAGITLLL